MLATIIITAVAVVATLIYILRFSIHKNDKVKQFETYHKASSRFALIAVVVALVLGVGLECGYWLGSERVTVTGTAVIEDIQPDSVSINTVKVQGLGSIRIVNTPSEFTYKPGETVTYTTTYRELWFIRNVYNEAVAEIALQPAEEPAE